ncbi:MAG: alpha/beta fold hydrolase [Vagococcus sp.]
MEKIISSLDGTHIYYQVIGSGPPLFFIHGNSGNHLTFKRQINSFKHHYKLILMDTRDHGRSSNATNTLTFGQIMTDIQCILANENIQSSSFLGFSDGANIALTFAAYFPNRISRLILVSPNVTYHQLKRMQQFISNQIHFLSKYVLRLKKKSRVLKLAMKDLPISAKQYQHVTAPALVIMGDHDIVDVSSMTAFVSYLPNARLEVLTHCVHSIPFFRGKELNSLTHHFLENN